MKRSRPDTFEAPYPAFQSHFPPDQKDYVMSMLGVQSAAGAQMNAIHQSIAALASAEGPGKPQHVDSAAHDDASGYHNHVFIAYWSDPASQSAFWGRADVVAQLDAVAQSEHGWWRESLVAPLTSHDGSYAVSDARYGIGRTTEQKPEQFHSYFGSMRDRVPDYLEGLADGSEGQIAPLAPPQSFGRHLRVTALPDKLCFIRGGFGWDKATEQEQQDFLADMLPVFKTGALFLRDNAVENNCISMRFLEEVDLGTDNGVQAEILGWFLTLKELERWTHHHPTHLAIFNGVFQYMRKFNFEPRLNLGHEVQVIPAGQVQGDYVNCHPETGFLRFFPAEEISS